MVLFWHRFELLAAARFSGRHNLPPNGDTLSPQETQNSSARFGFPLVPSTSDGNGVEHSLAATPVGGDRRTSTRAMSMPNEHDDRADDWSSNASEELTRSMLSLLHDGSPFPSSANLAPRLTPYSRPRHDSHANNGTSGVTSSFIYQENTEDMHSHVDARDFILANNESIFEQLHNDIYISRADRESYDRHQFQPIRQSFGHVSPSSSMGSVTERRIDAHTEPVSLDERRHNDANTRDRGVRSPTLNGENETSALRSILFSSGDSFFTTDSTSNGAT